MTKEDKVMKKSIKILTEYYADGYDHRILKRNGDIALVEKLTRVGKPNGYEVIIIRRNSKVEFPPENEKDWGDLGWTYMKRKNAEEIYEALCKNNGLAQPQNNEMLCDTIQKY